jgi:hypothetical protein
MSPMRGGRLLREAGDSQAIKIPVNSIELSFTRSIFAGRCRLTNMFTTKILLT